MNQVLYPILLQLHQATAAHSAEALRDLTHTQMGKTPTQLGRVVCRFGDSQLNGRVVQEVALFPEDKSQAQGTPKRFAFRQPDESLVQDLGASQRVLGQLVTPVGSYGDTLAREMVLTSAILTEIARKNLTELSRDAIEHNEVMFRHEAARVREADREETPLENATLAIVTEGIMTVNQALSILLMHQVPGAKDGYEAIQQLIFNGEPHLGLLTDLAGRIPVGTIGPMAMTGESFDHGVEQTQDGRIQLSAALKRTIRRMWEAEQQKRPAMILCPAASVLRGDELLTLKDRSNGKSMARTVSGIQLVAESWWRVFQAVHAMNTLGDSTHGL